MYQLSADPMVAEAASYGYGWVLYRESTEYGDII